MKSLVIFLFLLISLDLFSSEVGNNDIFSAVEVNDINRVKQLLKDHDNVNAINSKGDTPLFIAVKKKNITLVKLLLNNNSNIYAKNGEFQNILDFAKSLNDNSEEILRIISLLTVVFNKVYVTDISIDTMEDYKNVKYKFRSTINENINLGYIQYRNKKFYDESNLPIKDIDKLYPNLMDFVSDEKNDLLLSFPSLIYCAGFVGSGILSGLTIIPSLVLLGVSGGMYSDDFFFCHGSNLGIIGFVFLGISLLFLIPTIVLGCKYYHSEVSLKNISEGNKLKIIKSINADISLIVKNGLEVNIELK